MRDRGMWWSVVVTALAVGCLAATYALVVQGQEAAPSARRLAAMKADYALSDRPVENRASICRSLLGPARIGPTRSGWT
jgi:hypothetical protein